jgi:tetratricopeptide (TPR) repeat protein
MGKLDEAESNYRQAASVMAENNSPAQSQAVVQNQITIVQTEQGKLPIVWADVDRKYQLQPTLETAVILAELHQKAGISKPALEQREEYLKRKPHDKSSLLYLFAAYKLTGDNYAAASMAQRLIDDDPKNSQTYYFELAQGQERMGDKKAAMESYRRAVEGRNSEISKKAQERVDSLSASD